MIRLRYYQDGIKTDIYNQWAAGVKNVLAVLPTGGGKTVVFGSILAEEQGASCAIAHRQELVGQISLALARYGVLHKIIGPQNVIKAICREHVAETGRVWYDPNAKCAVAGVDTLIKRGDDLKHWLASVKLWVTDECFPAGTLIDGRPISSLQVGDTVTAFDEKTGTFAAKKVVRLFKNIAPENMTCVKSGRHVLSCTSGHPIFTKRGWVPAISLTTDDEVLIDELHFLQQNNSGTERGVTVQVPQNRAHLLQSEMRPSVSGREQKTESENGLPSARVHDLHPGDTGALVLSERDVPKCGPGLLQQAMLDGLPFEDIVINDGQNEPCARLGTNENQQPDGQAGSPSQGQRNPETYKTSTSNPGREWRAADDCGTSGVYDAAGLGFYDASYCTNGETRESERLADALQNRRRELNVETGDRDRRAESSYFGKAGAGLEENQVFNWHGVDSVTFYKRAGDFQPCGSIDDGFVYNIEVEDFHTYIANGVVVHNCHHLLDSNKWGKAAQMFPNARGLGVTATPTRADGKGLGRHAHGVFDTMVLGPTMRQLINEGYLTDYRLIVSKSDIVMNDKPGASGDWSPVQLRAASKESHIIDDVVGRYLKWAPNKLGVTFATDVETATDMAAAFRKAGVTAEVVHAKTPDDIRRSILARFKRREIMMLINVDLFGEGFDLPAIETVILARPTESYSLFAQQFGRVLRLLIDPEFMTVWDDFSVADRLAIIAASTKPAGIVIDLVGAIVRHNGPPDIRNDWTLDARSSKGESKNDAEPLSYCVNPECANVYPKYKKACPFCGHTLPITARNSPEAVAGDLIELDAETLAALRAQLSGVTKSVEDYRMELMAQGLPSIWIMSNVKKHHEKCAAYLNLKDASEWLVGEWLAAGLSMSECHRRFYFKFGMDVLTAYALPKADAIELTNKIDTLLTPASFAARVNIN